MNYGLIGEHLGHSFSKKIHEMIMDYKYELKELQPDQVEAFMVNREFQAINVTIPYKQTVIAFLDEIDEKAAKIGAVNTIVNKDGKLVGYNTDYDGIIALLKKNNVNPKDKNILILGTGGTSNTAYSVFEDLGASSIIKVSRTGKGEAITYEEAVKHSETNIIFNCTPCGMFPNNDDCPISLDSFDYLEAVFDAIYNPLRTNLIISAKKKGLISDGGLYMLVAQAVVAIEKFKDIKVNENVLDDIYQKILKEKENLVLIGMPGCGKSTIGKAISDCNFIDVDEELVKRIGNISDFIINNGEQLFRLEESKEIKRLSSLNGLVIATGGGAILKEENIDHLKQNGLIVYLKRDLEKLQIGNGRPLSSDFDSLKKRYEERKDLYVKYADCIIDNNRELDVVLEEIKAL